MNNFSLNSQSLTDWLSYLESIHPSEIELGLTRVKAVALKLGLLDDLGKVILVGGTNGKGSTSAILEQLILATGASTGVFSSPHLLRYNERLRINGQELADDFHIEALRTIEVGREATELTYFEFNTLAALYLMKQAKVDYFILEVGLGGRLDSTNIVDADLAVITTIDLDHQAWLGTTREAVAFEKSGIFRQNQLVICGEPNPPQPLLDRALELNCNIAYKGKDFTFEHTGDLWQWKTDDKELSDLPLTRLPMTNAATALAAFDKLELNLSHDTIKRVMGETSLLGRLQTIANAPDIVLDVAHNPEAGRYLAQWLKQHPAQSIHCVCAMLADKDSASTLDVVAPYINHWYLASLDCPRGADASQLEKNLQSESVQGLYNNVSDALDAAKQQATEQDLIIVFGSFFTVAEVLEQQK
ncbi:bifunctional tetrahydrofolate synthase/dihydrofolate synthase [Psychrobium sp. 1_MG-2023]|uniref:bifunctional tetrahydrofolate synthase/dihydrofolate synthase n=1 Tax=Psychrobium sp. 1_MG-2023 TaxID=3062624 RepID=UPI000C31D3A8|nr:bifunctional tetrahydrofolate synthase/dihydrofolate synthase [Psychrobium sp. 1_MG-2023]MDP2561749.1 bifunctional tetrahydrofolate synthase/dihydrofolate synthase [Psychrobium sp. 1_MG-2023]PKF59763.1 bifunctional tetrahydrofolate synthase/dihydrofolate synthase [Alteromonadales bacterium alter-6D02]